MNTNTVSVYQPHPSNISNTGHSPSGTPYPIIARNRKNFPDEFVLNMKVVQNGSTSTDTISTCLSDVSNTADMEPSPYVHLSITLGTGSSSPDEFPLRATCIAL